MATTENNTSVWLAAYLYYGEPWETLLSEAVKPFAETILKEGLAEQYFFIRYWERGPHIRLRFKGDPKVLEETVKPRLQSHFEDWMKANPSERREPENMPAEHAWYPNNSVQFVEYEPETDRYGGPHGLVVSEAHFQDASDAILAIIGEAEEWDYSRALGAAIQLHLGFLIGLSMDFKESKAFFNRVSRGWLPRAFMHYGEELPEEEVKRRKEETEEAFEKNFQEQQEALVPFFETVWEALQEGQEFEQQWLNDWVSNVARTRRELVALQEKDQLIVPPYLVQYGRHKEVGFPDDAVARWTIYESYVHMVNNRLGVMNQDEAYLGYLIRRSFETIERAASTEK